jgi:hypothetical protein
MAHFQAAEHIYIYFMLIKLLEFMIHKRQRLSNNINNIGNKFQLMAVMV